MRVEKSDKVKTLRNFCGLLLVFLSGWLLQAYAFPLYDQVFLGVRASSSIVSGTVLIAMAFGVIWKPQLFKRQFYLTAALVCAAVGLLFFGIGYYSNTVLILVVGATLSAISRSLVSVLVGLACLSMKTRTAGICLAGAYLLSRLICFLLEYLPSSAGVLLYALFPYLAIALVAKYASPVFQKMTESDSFAQLSVTQPSSFLPFQHQLFICVLLFRAVYGYALRLSEVEGVQPVIVFTLIPLCVVFIVVVASRKSLNPDILFQVSFVFVVAGLLLLALPPVVPGVVIDTLLDTAVGCFSIMSWFLLIRLGSKNEVGAMALFSWYLALIQIGTTIGSRFGRLTDAQYDASSPEITLLIAFVILVFVVYVAIVLKNFSFSKTIDAVYPGYSPTAKADVSYIKERSKDIGEKYGLTAREQEVFELLARGRNAHYIQDELIVSYNTVKVHVRHVYQKLGVHTQQELIDIAEDVHEDKIAQ